MKLAIIGSRTIKIESLEAYAAGADEIVSGGAKGVDCCAAEYAKRKGLKLTEFLPQYERYGRAAPVVRNQEIVQYADEVVAFWDGHSRGTLSAIRFAQKLGKPCNIIMCEKVDG